MSYFNISTANFFTVSLPLFSLRLVYGLHLTRILAAWNVLAARNVKSTGRAGLGTKNVTTIGIVVPGVNAGIFTTALTGTPTTVSDCVPVPALT